MSALHRERWFPAWLVLPGSLTLMLLWLLPQLVVWPLLFLLAAAGIGTVVQAARRLYRLPKK